MQCVKTYMNNIDEVIKIMEKYSLDTSKLNAMLSEIKYFRVTCPIIGNFSTGKSSLINALIGKRILSVDITPETAIPTEIYYGNNRVRCFYEGKEQETEISIDDLPLKDLTIDNTSLVKIEYNCDILKEVLNVKIVDLPGFDSGIELHNKAIDQYVANSLAYILAVSVDEPVLKENIENFLKELDFHEVPIYVILTKSARISKDEIEACKTLVEGIVRKLIKKADVKIGVAESYGDIYIEDLKNILYEIQKNVDTIFENKYSEPYLLQLNNLKLYFEDQLNKKDMELSELEVEKQQINIGINELLAKLSKEKKNFETQMEDCIMVIRKKIYSDLEKSVDGISVMIQNGKSINDKISMIVRTAVAIGIKTEFEPRLQKYLKKISSMIDIDVTNDAIIKTNIDKIISENAIYNATKMVLPMALAGVGAVFGPLGITIGAITGTFIDGIINVSQSNIRQIKAQETANIVIETVAKQSSDAVASEIRRYLNKINIDMENDIFKQKELLDRSLEDIEMRIAMEYDEKTKKIKEIEMDLDIMKNKLSI